MDIGVPAETKNAERRVGLTPAAAGELVARGHDVRIETGAGEGAGFCDVAYKEVGATIAGSADQVFADAEMIVKVKEPLAPSGPVSGPTTPCSPSSTWQPTVPRPKTSWPAGQLASPTRR